MVDPIIIGNRIRNLRGDKSRETVADAVGVSVSAMGMYESGMRVPRDEIKVRFAQYFGVSIESIFYADEVHDTWTSA